MHHWLAAFAIATLSVFGGNPEAKPVVPPDPKLVAAIREAGGQLNYATQAGDITFVGFYNEQPERTDWRFEFLKELGELQHLAMNHTKSSEWMASLSQLPKLEVLETYRCNITDKTLQHLKTVKSLRQLTLEVGTITDDGLKVLVGLERLESLSLQHMPITNEGLKTIARIPNLKKVVLVDLKVTPEGFLALRDSPIEEVLWWDEDRWYHEILPYLVQMKNLKRLALSLGTNSDQVADQISSMRSLEQLNLHGHQLSDDGLRKLSKLTTLRRLDISLDFEANMKHYTNRISDRGLESLVTLKNLESLGLSRTPVTDVGLQHIAKLPALKHLGLSLTKVTSKGLSLLSERNQLETLDITETPAAAEEILDLRAMKSLKSVTAYGADEGKILVPKGCAVTTFD